MALYCVEECLKTSTKALRLLCLSVWGLVGVCVCVCVRGGGVCVCVRRGVRALVTFIMSERRRFALSGVCRAEVALV